MIRVLLVDDLQLVRAGLRMLCESADDVTVVGEAGDGRTAARLAEQLLPDVILMDLRMPLMDGIAATEAIVAARPGTRIIALTTFDDDDHLYPALAAGACGFLVKDTSPGELLDAVRRAAAGESTYSQEVLRRLVADAVRSRTATAAADHDDLAQLTDRELDVLALVGTGLSNAEIAERLHLGLTTVKTHLASLMTKTGCPNRVRLAVFAVRARIATP
ncbi:response regulator [Nonomuraea jiangxiensis]|uniref:DNA-binding response regulator, NarL/FixJ family, contains REC and HTH domains n=1 Tax=Nonomuraea jiangxiensis TaxID=633440 RepID=A0A1G9JPE6_9ACTN|nr:response regulator transcription factor [Nonomuraea jiangxiensis]SDL39437.1 DNA-binding response regulator, NarL/FixJ family, contains REC and HTH domains [Nonomuraea jiangxiensis]